MASASRGRQQRTARRNRRPSCCLRAPAELSSEVRPSARRMPSDDNSSGSTSFCLSPWSAGRFKQTGPDCLTNRKEWQAGTDPRQILPERDKAVVVRRQLRHADLHPPPFAYILASRRTIGHWVKCSADEFGRRATMENVTTIGLDIAKSVFHGQGRRGRARQQERPHDLGDDGERRTLS